MFSVNGPQAEQERDWKVVSLNWRLFDNARFFLLNTTVKNTKSIRRKILYPQTFVNKVRTIILQHTHNNH